MDNDPGDDWSDFAKTLSALSATTPFFYYFGLFVWRFATVERSCHYLFHNVCGLREEIARQIIGGEQLSKVTRLLNVVVQTGKFSAANKQEMQDTINQLNAISKLRHALIHRATDVVGNEMTISNLATAKSQESVEILKLNLDHIINATKDLGKISLRLSVFPFSDNVERFPHVLAELSAPWRYKQIEPDRPNQPPRNTHQ